MIQIRKEKLVLSNQWMSHKQLKAALDINLLNIIARNYSQLLAIRS